MIEISNEVKNEVNLIVDYLEKYQNQDNLSWLEVYSETLSILKIERKDNLLLSNTVKEITNRGYDIISEPFKLERFR